jgi:hypothetical protein
MAAPTDPRVPGTQPIGGGGTPPPVPTKFCKPPPGIYDPKMTEEQLRGTPAYSRAVAWGASDTDALVVAAIILGDPQAGVENASAWLTNQPDWLVQHPGYQEGVKSGIWGNPASYSQTVLAWKNLGTSYGLTVTDAQIKEWGAKGYTTNQVQAIFQTQTGGIQVTASGAQAPDSFYLGWGFSQAEIDTAKKVWSGQDNVPADLTLASQMNFIHDHVGELTHLGYTSRSQAVVAWQKDPSGVGLQYTIQDNTNAAANAGAGASEALAEARKQATATGIVRAFSPALQGIFSPAEIQAYANWQAGLTVGNETGEKISELVNLAGPTNQLFMHFYGRAVTRAQLEQYWASGATPDVINNELQSRGIQSAFSPDVQSLFSPDEIKSYSDQNAGIQTQNGQKMDALVRLAVPLNNLYKQYYGRNITRDELNQAFAAGDTPELASARLGGQAYINANQGDIQYYSGAFGQGQLSQGELTQLGYNKSGLGTPQGQALQAAFDKAVQRAQSAFSGVVAHLTRSGLAQQFPGSGLPPDVTT